MKSIERKEDDSLESRGPQPRRAEARYSHPLIHAVTASCGPKTFPLRRLRLFEPRSSPPPHAADCNSPMARVRPAAVGEQQEKTKPIRVIPHFSFAKKKNEWNLYREIFLLRYQSSITLGGMTNYLFHKTVVTPATR